MKLSGNTILITGGTSGIGFALASRLLERGNTVLITGRTEERLAAARANLPGIHTYVCDQSDPTAITRLQSDVVQAFPGLNVLINNAGIGLKRNLSDSSVPLAELEREIDTNLTGPLQLIAELLPHLKRQPSATIVNVTSGLAFVPFAMKPIYCATKAAMHSYTQSLRVQLARTQVKVVELVPPAVQTEFNKGQEDMNVGHRMDVAKLADAAMQGLERGRDEILPGPAALLGWIRRLAPNLVVGRAGAEQMGLEG